MSAIYDKGRLVSYQIQSADTDEPIYAFTGRGTVDLRVCNTGATLATVRVGIAQRDATAGGVPSLADDSYQLYDMTVAAQDSGFAFRNLPVSYGDVLIVRSDSTDVVFRLSGECTAGVDLLSMYTHTRASGKTYIGPNGTRLTASANENPDEYDPDTLENIGPSFWEARTNLLLNSGTPATQGVAVANATQYTLWVEGSGTATVSGDGSGSATEGSPLVFTTTGTSITVTVTGSLDIFQLEAGGFATPYIPTTGSTATRAEDVAVISGAAFGAIWIESGGSIFADGSSWRANGRFVTWALAPDNDYAAGVTSGAAVNGGRLIVRNASATQADIAVNASLSEGDSRKIAVRFSDNDFHLACNGTLGTPDISGTIPTDSTQTFIGSLDGTALFLNGNIKTLIGYSQALTNDQLTGITS